jgi:ABC-type multidrug transport system ATPase subunit
MNTGLFKSQKNSKSRNLQGSYLFHLENLSVKFKNVIALNSVKLVVNPGEILFITGASGAGKTTLLNVLAGDIKPSKGKAIRPGKNSFVAQVFQDLRLLNDKSCEENLWVAYDSGLYKNKNEFYQDMMELCKVLGIWDYKDILIKNANGGLKQKVAMVRALLAKPDVILADEPSAALDKDSAVKLFEVLNFYNVKRGTTIIWATHNRELIKQFPGKIAHLDAGKLVYTGHACFI